LARFEVIPLSFPFPTPQTKAPPNYKNKNLSRPIFLFNLDLTSHLQILCHIKMKLKSEQEGSHVTETGSGGQKSQGKPPQVVAAGGYRERKF